MDDPAKDDGLYIQLPKSWRKAAGDSIHPNVEAFNQNLTAEIANTIPGEIFQDFVDFHTPWWN